VKGFDKGTETNLKVIVYVHTDIWYIHPFAGGGEGDSWAAVKSDGTWSIPTVKRRFSADKVAALVVPKKFDPPAKLPSLGMITDQEATTVRKLKGTEDYGKL
jgi:hypothetical protein